MKNRGGVAVGIAPGISRTCLAVWTGTPRLLTGEER